jgi:F-type H+-transporting ATPase subunit epsilon
MTLRLRDSTRTKQVEQVTHFIGEDASGSFGILPGHARTIIALTAGLARFRIGDDPWMYLALPGGILYLRQDLLTICTRRFLIDEDYTRIASALQEQLLQEEENLRAIKSSLRQMEDSMFKRLSRMGKAETGL